jgi:hypothetical protein
MGFCYYFFGSNSHLVKLRFKIYYYKNFILNGINFLEKSKYFSFNFIIINEFMINKIITIIILNLNLINLTSHFKAINDYLILIIIKLTNHASINFY